jgi:hypothetical protein
LRRRRRRRRNKERKKRKSYWRLEEERLEDGGLRHLGEADLQRFLSELKKVKGQKTMN